MTTYTTCDALDQAVTYLNGLANCFDEATPEHRAYQSASSIIQDASTNQQTIETNKIMKQYCITTTVNVFVNAKDLDQAHEIFGDIDIKFTDRDGESVEHHYIDTDIFEVDAD